MQDEYTRPKPGMYYTDRKLELFKSGALASNLARLEYKNSNSKALLSPTQEHGMSKERVVDIVLQYELKNGMVLPDYELIVPPEMSYLSTAEEFQEQINVLVANSYRHRTFTSDLARRIEVLEERLKKSKKR